MVALEHEQRVLKNGTKNQKLRIVMIFLLRQGIILPNVVNPSVIMTGVVAPNGPVSF
jgi:hypothetical protein